MRLPVENVVPADRLMRYFGCCVSGSLHKGNLAA